MYSLELPFYFLKNLWSQYCLCIVNYHDSHYSYFSQTSHRWLQHDKKKHLSILGLYMAILEAFSFGSSGQLSRPCVDCGLITGSFCDFCKASDRCPKEKWQPNQMTPLCPYCDRKHKMCHFCRGQKWCVPPPQTQRSSTTSWSHWAEIRIHILLFLDAGLINSSCH